MEKRYFHDITMDSTQLAKRHTYGGELGEVILKAIAKEGLTYEEAYAGLDYAYAALRFSANFAQIQPTHIQSLTTQFREERDRIQNASQAQK